MKKSSLSHAVRLALALVILRALLVAPPARRSSAAQPTIRSGPQPPPILPVRYFISLNADGEVTAATA